MPLFGKKKDSGTDIEAAEEDGLLIQTGGAPAADETAPAPQSVPEPAPPVDLDEPLSDDAESALAGLDGNEGDRDETDGEESEEGSTQFSVAASEDSKEDDILSMFNDSESYGDLAELTKDIDDVAASDLLAELREIRSMLPAEALEDQQAA
jgi:hypothetical protein